MLRALAAVLLISGSVFAQTPQAIPAPSNFPIDGDVGEWANVPPTFTLHPSPSGRDGVVWIAQNNAGIIVAGKVSGGAPDYPRLAADLLAKDHIEVWLAFTRAPKMPPIGWGHQFGPQVITSEAECNKKGSSDEPAHEPAKCVQWFRAQAPWREKMRRLFVYQYAIAPGMAAEEFATPAYRAMLAVSSDLESTPNLTKSEHEMFAAAQPPAPPNTAKFRPTNDGYTFEAVFPWDALPPADSLDLSSVLLMVDVFSAAPAGRKTGAYSTTSTTRKWGDPSTFTVVRLASPRQYQIGDCAHRPSAKDIYGDQEYQLYYRPGPNNVVNNTFFLHNTARGYQYEPQGMSPVVEKVDWFAKKISDHEWVCGKQLAYRRDDKVVWSEFTLDPNFETKRLPDGTLLINDQPRVDYSYFGSGQCGACARPGITIYRVPPSGVTIDTALAWGDVVGNEVDDADIHVAPDWSKVTIFEEFTNLDKPDDPAKWRSETFCLQGSTYNSCAKQENVPEPKPRILKDINQDQ